MAHVRTLADVAAHGVGMHLDANGVPETPLTVIELNACSAADMAAGAQRIRDDSPTGVLVGVADRPLPDSPDSRRLIDALDIVLAPDAPQKSPAGSRRDLADIDRQVAAAPVAATTLVAVLRSTAGLPVDHGLMIESFAYSTLLGGTEFRTWLTTRRASAAPALDAGHRVHLKRDGNRLEILLDRPERRNAFDAMMRDALHDALEIVALDPTIDLAVLRGAGSAFSSGGDLAEFGTADDLARSALVRSSRGAALPLHRVADRVRCEVHGACVGAGIEVPSFAGVIAAREDAWFQLPELGMGLIPGAGGTIGIPRRIGRWRTAYMAMTGRKIDRTTAHDWGLIDELS